MSDHRHETYDIYGTAATRSDVERLESEVRGLREDLGIAEGRIRDLELAQQEFRAQLRDHDHGDGVASDG
jgi:hypothetical protein